MCTASLWRSLHPSTSPHLRYWSIEDFPLGHQRASFSPSVGWVSVLSQTNKQGNKYISVFTQTLLFVNIVCLKRNLQQFESFLVKHDDFQIARLKISGLSNCWTRKSTSISRKNGRWQALVNGRVIMTDCGVWACSTLNRKLPHL